MADQLWFYINAGQIYLEMAVLSNGKMKVINGTIEQLDPTNKTVTIKRQDVQTSITIRAGDIKTVSFMAESISHAILARPAYARDKKVYMNTEDTPVEEWNELELIELFAYEVFEADILASEPLMDIMDSFKVSDARRAVIFAKNITVSGNTLPAAMNTYLSLRVRGVWHENTQEK